MFSFSSFLPFVLLAMLLPARQATGALLPRELAVDLVHRFPLGTWIENLAFRPSRGTVLANSLAPSAMLYEVDPKTSQAHILHNFTSVTGVAGIVELGHDVFYVAGGNFSFATFTTANDSAVVFRVDLSGKAPVVSVAVKFPFVGILNGMTALNKDTLLVCDSGPGIVYAINVTSNTKKVAIQDATMKNGSIGINGVHIFGNHLFYTNTDSETFYKIPINLTTGTATGPAVLVTSGLPGDDFILDRKGDVYLCANSENELILLPGAASAGSDTVKGQVIAGSVNSTALAGVTAAEFGTDGWLYLSSTGGIAQYGTGNFSLGGAISRVRVKY